MGSSSSGCANFLVCKKDTKPSKYKTDDVPFEPNNNPTPFDDGTILAHNPKKQDRVPTIPNPAWANGARAPPRTYTANQIFQKTATRLIHSWPTHQKKKFR